ncbi:divisome protein SepX/GlpR [Actinoalloteichus caeruleus]|uniref:divisome protein SepX/GlpR n=1 Tax=Actinoalloteichus cyanogriseus TaxID=2893586 RepID=UPI0004AB6C9D
MSSLIFVGLAVAWLVVLVPMIARRRREVSRTADSELAARVVRRGRSADAVPAARNEFEEELSVPEKERDEDTDLDDEGGGEPGNDEDQWRSLNGDDVRAGRRYRPGRGGFDPEAAARVAKAKYAFRQRVVLALITLAVVLALVAGFAAMPMLWWAHGAVDLGLLGYLVYLRRQVRIEEAVRQRRAARIAEAERRAAEGHSHVRPVGGVSQGAGGQRTGGSVAGYVPGATQRPNHHGAFAVELDDDDPAFDELDVPHHPYYRRAVGE